MKNRYIAIVDDDPDAREVLEIILSTLEIPLIQITNGSDAVAKVKAEPPLLIVLDLSMPKLDGREVLKELRSHPPTATVPVIVFTASPRTPNLVDELALPTSMILQKGSVSMTELRRLVISILKPEIHVDLAFLQEH